MKKLVTSLCMLSSLLLANEASNLMSIGIQTSTGTTNRTFENTTGSRDESFDLKSYKILVGKDFAIYGTDAQTSRFYLAYKYNDLDSDIFGSYNTFSLGYQENMDYLPLLNTQNHKILPLIGLELGYATADNGFSEDAFSSEFNAGLVYQFYNMELSLAYTYNYVSWNNSDARDDFNNNQVSLGFTYKIMTGDQ